MNRACPYCGPEVREEGLGALGHAVCADDLDLAIELGLLTFEPVGHMAACARCMRILDRVIDARDARRNALAARERHRTRTARLALHAQARAERRRAADSTPGDPVRMALPSAAAAALARAKSRAAGTS